jgi:hypothetical protein
MTAPLPPYGYASGVKPSGTAPQKGTAKGDQQTAAVAQPIFRNLGNLTNYGTSGSPAQVLFAPPASGQPNHEPVGHRK